MKKILLITVTFFTSQMVIAQGEYGAKFEQLGTQLPTPNTYRTGSGAPGPDYWQQQADYHINVELDDENQRIIGSETITYTHRAPEPLDYLWVQLDQNVRASNSDSPKIKTLSIRNDSIPTKFFQTYVLDDVDYEGGYQIKSVKDHAGKNLPYVINKTMMRVEIPAPLKTGEQFVLSIDWSYNIYDRMMVDGRGGYEYFPEDGNYAYTIAQWFPRMCVYDDVNGWQNKQFLGRGEFALPFGHYVVNITAPADHVVGATGELQNPQAVLTKEQLARLDKAKKNYDKPVIIISQKDAEANEKSRSKEKKTWIYHADNVRDFAFASSRKYIWDAMAVKIGDKSPLAMSYYPKEGNPLWEKESTIAVANTLKTYSKFTIDYPYPVAISVHAANQGMEYPMICFNYGRPKPDGTYSDHLRRGMIGVIIHEVGHNFFPMIINSDERQWTWMDEGLNTFVELMTKREYYPEYANGSETPQGIVGYMKGEKQFQRPIMTNSENILQFGSNAYSKPSAALVVLRESVMGPELFDHAFKEYARRWAFKHPKPADFFRTLEDASAVDLDWFWKGWFYSTDHVDIAIDEVRWFKVNNDKKQLEKRVKANKKGPLGGVEDKKATEKAIDFSQGAQPIVLTDMLPAYYGEFKNRVDDQAIRESYADANFYEVKLKNKGGLVSPVIIEWTYKDGTKEIEKLPAEIWRKNENEIVKVFSKSKEVANISIDPDQMTADTNTNNNHFPKREENSKFNRFKEKSGK
ncbi:M1 family metallopeptidase [Fulvivirgaceae bacterium BMA12]|uniref:M1 family metallopeptidase n=1 Tax=Agaribacillus aureus TaxID=3051825 RepID=A0ABT8L4S5_9BACT|nr:M1 family metallopeptidase [Fulvivirgaceae bacterium BMA12]